MSTLEELRARLESAEAALRDAQESRFALIIQNEELGAELVAIRARLESAEAAAQKALDVWGQTYIAGDHGINLVHAMIALRESLDAAGENRDR